MALSVTVLFFTGQHWLSGLNIYGHVMHILIIRLIAHCLKRKRKQMGGNGRMWNVVTCAVNQMAYTTRRNREQITKTEDRQF